MMIGKREMKRRSKEVKRSRIGGNGCNDVQSDHEDNMRNTKVTKRDLSPHEQVASINLYKKLAQQIRGSAMNDVIDGTNDSLHDITCSSSANSIFKGIWKGDFPQSNAVENRKWTAKAQGLMYIDEILGDGQEPKGKYNFSFPLVSLLQLTHLFLRMCVL